MNPNFVLRIATLVVLFVGLGCARRTMHIAGAMKRQIPRAEILSPEKTKFDTPDIREVESSEVRVSDLIGKWKLDFHGVVRLIDHVGMTEWTKSSDFVETYEFAPDGTAVMTAQNGNRLTGSWQLSEGVLSIDLRGSGNGALRKWKVRNVGGRMIEQRQPDVADFVRGRGEDMRGFRKTTTTGGYDADGALRYSWSYVDLKRSDNVFTHIVEIPPRILYRVDETLIDARDIVEERKRNLDSLLKAGIITDEEYRSEMKRGIK